MADTAKFCSHCLPQKVRRHWGSRSGYYLEKIGRLLKMPKTTIFADFNDSAWLMLMDSLKMLRLVAYEANFDESQIQNRHLIFFREAKRRGIQIYAVKFLGKYTADFVYYWHGQKFLYEGNPICNSVNHSAKIIDDKYFVKKLLKAHNLPIAEGDIFTNRTKAKEYAGKVGFPLVVKPRSGSLSKHVITNIKSLDELHEAIAIAQKYRKDFMVEKYVAGRLYRATVIGKKQVFVCEKDAPNVVGNGSSTIEELAKMKNSLENRQDTKNVTLHKVHIDNGFLQSQNLSAESVPKKDQRVYVNPKTILSFGCDVINCSDKIHPDNKKMFTEIAELTNSNLIGLDFICKDISISHRDQESAILELNSLPYIDMHENPSSGASIPVSKIVWDFVLSAK